MNQSELCPAIRKFVPLINYQDMIWLRIKGQLHVKLSRILNRNVR